MKLPVLALLASAGLATASATADGFAAFGKGDYNLAARSFETALAAGPPSFGAAYNLGLALKREGEAGRAAVALLQAIALEPREQDARIQLSDLERAKGIPMPRPSWTDLFAEHVPIVPALICGMGFFWLGLFALLGCAWLRRRAAASTLALLCALAGAGVFVAAYLADPRFAWRDVAVVTDANGVEVLAAPADRSERVASLPAASRVAITGGTGQWSYVRLPDGRRGWVGAGSLTPLLPQEPKG